MLIKANKKRILFEKILRDLGYKDRSPIIIPKEPFYHEILNCMGKGDIIINVLITKYENKKSYLYDFFCKIHPNLSKNEIKKQLSILCENILFKEKTRIAEVGWRVEELSKQFNFWNKKDRLELFLSVLICLKILIKNGILNIKPNPGDILVSKPEGGKGNGLHHEKAVKIGSDQRAKIYKKLGFGKVKFNNSQYGRYDENCNLTPI